MNVKETRNVMEPESNFIFVGLSLNFRVENSDILNFSKHAWRISIGLEQRENGGLPKRANNNAQTSRILWYQ